MSRITKIDYIESSSLTNLMALVNDAISRGWQPFGAVVYYEIDIYKTNCVQAVVQYDEFRMPISFPPQQFIHGEVVCVPCGDMDI